MTTLWLDIEGTIIKSWEEPFIINQEKIQNLICEFLPDEIGVFSFAIWNDKDREFFKDQIGPHLEKIFGIQITHIPTKQEVFQAIKKANKKQFDFDDFCDFWGKENGFSDWIRATNSGTHILIDDLVEDCEIFFKNSHIVLKNI